MHTVLKMYHQMVGVDLHPEIVPPIPEEIPFVPFLVTHTLANFGLEDRAETVFAEGENIILRDSDISHGIPHAPTLPGVLSPIHTLFSSSKSYWGPSAVLAEGEPIAAALLGVVNLNLNCAQGFPMPSGIVYAPDTVVTSLTLGDILGGLFAALVEALCQALLDVVVGLTGLGPLIEPVISFLCTSPLPLELLKEITPPEWHDEIDGFFDEIHFLGPPMPGIPILVPPGYWGRRIGDLSDGARSLGEELGDRLTETTPPAIVPSLPDRPIPQATNTPFDAITQDPSVEEF